MNYLFASLALIWHSDLVLLGLSIFIFDAAFALASFLEERSHDVEIVSGVGSGSMATPEPGGGGLGSP